MQMAPTSSKGKHTINAEMNANSFEYGYFQSTGTVFIVQFFESRMLGY